MKKMIGGIWLASLAGAVLAGDVTEGKAMVDASTQIKVGTYYYPWYREPGMFKKNKWKRQVMRSKLEEPQKPMSQWYDSRDEKVIGEHIAQSIRGGIDFWSVSWWGPGSFTDDTFRNNILTHPDSAKLKYALLYESTGRFGKFESPNYDKWIGDLEYMQKTYFDDPRYLKVDGRPVLFVYLSREYFRNRGHDALKQMREQFPEIYLVGDDVFFGADDKGISEDTYEAEWAQHFDAVTAYDVYGQSVGPLGGTQQAIDFISGNYAKAKAEANSVGTAFIPAIAPGYNDTAVRDGHPGRARYFTDKKNSKEGDVFRAMIHEVARPNLDPTCGNILMVTSFNEWYEDSQIEPTARTAKPSKTDTSDSGIYYTGGQTYVDYGYLYLDILKEETTGLETGWTTLFDGKTLINWNKPFDWGEAEVVDGEIHLKADKKFFLISDKTYADFIFEADVKLPEGKANSGFLFRCHVKPNKAWGYQAEIDGSGRAWSGGLYDEAGRGWLWPQKPVDSPTAQAFREKTKGSFIRDDWNTCRIHAEGNRLRIWMNGVLCTDVEDDRDAEGYIGLQHHGEEGQLYRFRNIRIRELK